MRWKVEIDHQKHLAREEGLAEGRAEGRAEGIAKGEQQGKFEMVKSLLNVGTPIEFIKKATGWSEEKILEIAKVN